MVFFPVLAADKGARIDWASWEPGMMGLGLIVDSLSAIAFYTVAVLFLLINRRLDSSGHRLLRLFAVLAIAGGSHFVVNGLAAWMPTVGLYLGIQFFITGLLLYTAIQIAIQVLQKPAAIAVRSSNPELKPADDTSAVDPKVISAITTQPPQSEASFKAMFEQAAVGIARLSLEGYWLQVNQTLCDLLGYSPAELRQRSFRDITDPADSHQDDHYYQQLIHGKISSCRFEKRFLHKDGFSIWTLVTVTVEKSKDDRSVSFIAVIEDIRQLKQARIELEHRAAELEQVNGLLAITNALLEKQNEELDQFAYVSSHDLKAPLRAIATLSEWLEEDLGNELPDTNRHQLSLLRNRVHRMENLINGLLEYSRVGRRESVVEIVEIDALMEDVVDSIPKPKTFQVKWSTDVSTIKTNRTALRQVLVNLIHNGIRHRDRDDGQVTVSVRDRSAEGIEVVVSDNGPGIDPRYHQKIFTIFQTLKARDDFESTGIGLSIVKKTVESAGGSITVESRIGEGATFRFTWPKSPAH